MIIVDAGPVSAVVQPSPVRISFRDERGRSVLTTLGSPFAFTVGEQQIEQFTSGGPFVGNLMSVQDSGVRYAARRVLGVRRIGRGARLTMSTDDPTGRRLVVTIRPQGRRALRVSARPTRPAGVSVVAANFRSPPHEAFRGFGGRHNSLDQRGWELDSFLNQTNLSAPAPPGAPGPPGLYMFPNGPTGAYFVQSSFVSSRGYGFLLDRDELTRWRMASDRPDAWQVEVVGARRSTTWSRPGRPRRAIRTLTALTGRQRVPPRWALGAAARPARALPGPDRRRRTWPRCAATSPTSQRYRLPLGAYRIEGWQFMPAAARCDS